MIDREALNQAFIAFAGSPKASKWAEREFTLRSLEAAIAAYLTHAGEEAVPVGQWLKGAPSKPWSEEWFIAVTTYGDRVVLRALPEEYHYDFRTADDTYIKADKIKCWMQFPDSSYLAAAPHPPRQDGGVPITRHAEELAGAPCERCQGNGEIVTDWDRYMHAHDGDVGDEAVAECPDCNGTGRVSQDGAREEVERITAVAEKMAARTGLTFFLDPEKVKAFEASMLTTPPAPDEAVEAESQAVCDVLAERRRQIEVEGWTPKHDDKYRSGELLRAASAYRCYGPHPKFGPGQPPGIWPWAKKRWKPRTKRENLVRAGALCLAERDLVYRNFACPPVAGDNFRIHSEPDKLDPADDAYVQYLAIIAEIERLDRSRRDVGGGV